MLAVVTLSDTSSANSRSYSTSCAGSGPSRSAMIATERPRLSGGCQPSRLRRLASRAE